MNAEHPTADRGQQPPAGTVVLHMSRLAPKCCNCHHHVLRGGIKPACDHPAQPVDLDTGEPWVNPHLARTDADSCQKRQLYFCGPSGAGFHPRIRQLSGSVVEGNG